MHREPWELAKGRLLNCAGSVLDGVAPLKKARMQAGEPITLQVRRVDIQATEMAFAAILGHGSVVTWGSADDGGDSGSVRDQLKNVQQIQATRAAFAAILADGSVVTWGHAGFGSDSSAVQDQLNNVQRIQAP